MARESLQILITDPHLGGGGQVTYVTRLATELTRLGHEVTIGCREGSVLVAHAQEAGCSVYERFVFKGGFRPLVWWRDLREARRYLRERTPDIIHVNGSQDHWIFALANRSLRRRCCLLRTRHNTYTVKNHWANRRLNRHWTDYQIVVCEVVRRQLASQSAFDGRRMCSIHNGVDTERFKPDLEARTRAREEFGYTEEHVVCGIAARLVPAKGHEFLFKATAHLKDTFPNLRLLVLGQGNLEAQLRQMTIDLGIQDIVQFAGFREDMAYCTQAFDIGALPSIDCDTSSFSLKEEMASGKPVIASDYGGLKEIVNDGLEGLVVPAGSVAPLGSALRRLIRDPEARRHMGEAGRDRVLRDFAVEVFAQRTLTAYHRAIALHSGQGDVRA